MSAADARNGKDIQGIPWERLSVTREKYRQTRLEQYKNYENIPHSGEVSRKVISDFISFLSAPCQQDYFNSFIISFVACRIAKLLKRGACIMSLDEILDLSNQPFFIFRLVRSQFFLQRKLWQIMESASSRFLDLWLSED